MVIAWRVSAHIAAGHLRRRLRGSVSSVPRRSNDSRRFHRPAAPGAGTFAGARITLDDMAAHILQHDRSHAHELATLVDGDVRIALERFAGGMA
jgi:hypothetical protein